MGSVCVAPVSEGRLLFARIWSEMEISPAQDGADRLVPPIPSSPGPLYVS